MRSFTTLSITAMLMAGTITGAMAQTLSSTGTLYVGGANNTEGSSLMGKSLYVASNTGDPGYAAFTVLDFTGGTSAANSSITGLSLSILNYPSSTFGISGPMDVFLTSARSLTGTEGYTYQAAGTDGIGTQLGTLVNLGSVQYNALEAQGTPDTFDFTLSTAAKTLLAQDLSRGNTEIAFGVPVTSTTTARFDGIYYAPVTLSLTTATAAVPEASTTVSFGLLLAFGLGGLIVSRRRRAA